MVKAKFTLEQATQAQRGSRCIALLVLQPLRWMGVGGQRHAPAALPPAKTRYPLCRRLGGPQSRSGRVRKISPPPTGIRSPDRQARSESLYRLSYTGPYVITSLKSCTALTKWNITENKIIVLSHTHRHNCISVQCVSNWNTSVTGHKYLLDFLLRKHCQDGRPMSTTQYVLDLGVSPLYSRNHSHDTNIRVSLPSLSYRCNTTLTSSHNEGFCFFK